MKKAFDDYEDKELKDEVLKWQIFVKHHQIKECFDLSIQPFAFKF